MLGELLPGGDVELAEDVAQVGLHSGQADEERLGDLPVGQALGGELGNAPLCACERIDAAER
jgi:hypothetical protein